MGLDRHKLNTHVDCDAAPPVQGAGDRRRRV